MGLLLRLLLTAVAVYLTATLLPSIATVSSFGTAIIVAIVLALLNTFVKPILQLFSLPITILTLGLFLLIINVIIIWLADALVDGFRVPGFLGKLIFSLIVSAISWILSAIFD
jgi:putative membrane protein